MKIGILRYFQGHKKEVPERPPILPRIRALYEGGFENFSDCVYHLLQITMNTTTYQSKNASNHFNASILAQCPTYSDNDRIIQGDPFESATFAEARVQSV